MRVSMLANHLHYASNLWRVRSMFIVHPININKKGMKSATVVLHSACSFSDSASKRLHVGMANLDNVSARQALLNKIFTNFIAFQTDKN